MSRLPISVFIITKNEADRVPVAIQSVKDWVDEVIVVDSGSTDNTLQISRDLGAQAVFNEWPGYGPQKVYAEGLCKNDWVLNIDADEEISPALRDEIKAIFERMKVSGLKTAGYRLPILPIYNFQQSGHPWTAFHKPVRLYDKSRCGFKDEVIHDSVAVPKGVAIETLKGVINHRSFRSLEHHIEKVNAYSSQQAQNLKSRGRKTRFLIMLLLPIGAFFKAYILRREFVNGIDGLLTSHMYAFQRFIRYAKLREIENKKDKE